MKFDKNAIAKASKDLALLIEKRNTIPILSNVAITIRGDKATLTATNLEQQATITIAVESGNDCAFTVSGDKLSQITGAAKSGDFVMELESGYVTAKSGRSKWKLPTLPIDDFPDMQMGDGGYQFTIAADTLKDAIGAVDYAISTEESRYYLNGVCIHSEGGNLKLAASDGHRMCCIAMDAIQYDGPNVIIPRLNIAQIVKIVDGDVSVTVSAAKIAYEFGETTLISKLVDGVFPDYARVIPTGNDKIVQFDSGFLADALKRTTILADDKTRSVIMDIDKSRITLNVSASDGGVATEEVPVCYDGEPITYKCNGVYLRQFMEGIGGDMSIAFADSNASALLKSMDNAGWTGVLMGMRI